MRRKFSSRLSGTMLKKYASLYVPRGPPSADAPLSLMISTTVLSSSPNDSMCSMTRRTWSSVCEETGVDLHHPRVEAPLVVGQRRPGRHPARTFRQFGSRRQQPGCGLTREHFLAPRVPPRVELTAVPVDVVAGRLMGRVARTGREPQEERF